MRLALMLCALLVGCHSHPATQVIVVFHASAALRSDARSIHVRVEGPGGREALDDVNPLSPGTAGAVARVPLVPRGGDATRTFRIEGELLDAGDAQLASVEAVGGYVADELREIHLWFDDGCRGVGDCGPGRTCNRGVCVGACYEASPSGELTRSEATCSECEECLGGSCEPVEDGSACGCADTDACNAGVCVTSQPVAEAYGGHLHTCAGLRGNDVFCWGSNRVEQLGTGGPATSTPAPVDVPSAATGAAATDHTCWLAFTGARYCWGWNGAGQLGNGEVVDAPVATPTRAPDGDPDWEALDTGWYFTCGLTTDARVLCWGANDRGQCALDPETTADVPVPTPVDDEPHWTAVAAGGFHACGIQDDGTLWCWGLNDSGELGLGDGDSRHEPTQTGCVGGECFDDWVAVAAGDFHTCAIRESGDLWCWGGGLNGQLGVGPTMARDSTRPLKVDMGDWRAVAGGQSHTCGIREDGTLWCWGRNDKGQLGVGDLERRDVPARVRAPGGDDWIRLGLGRDHSCAVRSDETLWCWGWNRDGQLGLGFETAEGDAPVTRPRRVCIPPP